jgi:hypothetical protein
VVKLYELHVYGLEERSWRCVAGSYPSLTRGLIWEILSVLHLDPG